MPSLKAKLEKFLYSFDRDQNLDFFKDGMCNAFAFMNFRADILGEAEKNDQRMVKIYTSSNDDLRKAGKLLATYIKHYTDLAQCTDTDFPLGKINKGLNMSSQELIHLRKQASENKNDDALAFQIESLEKHIVETRKVRNHIIESNIKKTFGDQLIPIYEALEIYIYLHSLANAFDPGNQLNYFGNNYRTKQSDLEKIYELIPAGETGEVTFPVKQICDISFLFTKAELIYFFNYYLSSAKGSNVYFYLSSPNHSIYLSLKNRQFTLWNPKAIDIYPNTVPNLVTCIKNCFIKETKYEYTQLQIKGYINNTENNLLLEADGTLLIEAILQTFKNKNINFPMKNGTTALSYAAWLGQARLVKVLLQHGANPNIVDDYDLGPVHYAAYNDCDNVIKIMAKPLLNINIDLSSEDTITPLQVAATRNNINAAKALIECGASVNKSDEEGWTAIHTAVLNNSLDVLSILINAKANLNEITKHGETPVHIAAREGHINIIRLLIKHGAKLNQPNKKGQTPQYIAIENKQQKVAILIKKEMKKKEKKRNEKRKMQKKIHLVAEYELLPTHSIFDNNQTPTTSTCHRQFTRKLVHN